MLVSQRVQWDLEGVYGDLNDYFGFSMSMTGDNIELECEYLI